MYRITIFYPNAEGDEFNMDYYCSKHMPLVKERLGAACTGIGVDAGVGGGEPGAPATFAAIGYILGDDLDRLMAAVAEHEQEFINDVPNYTSVQPIIQVNEVKL